MGQPEAMADGKLSGVDPQELFRLLGNETRMAIMEVLWDDLVFQDYVTGTLEGLTFSDLLEQAGVDDSGNFNYHLSELTGQLIHDEDDGYQLSPLGYNLMAAIDRFGSFVYEPIAPTPLAESCPFCGGTLEGSYEHNLLNVKCQDCDGLGHPGNIQFVYLPSTGVHGRDLVGLLDTATLQLLQRVQSLSHGSCWSCHHHITATLEACDEHDVGDQGSCPHCHRRFGLVVSTECEHCGTAGQGPAIELAITEPSTQTAFAEAGIGPHELGHWRYRLAAFEALNESSQTASPFEIRYRFVADGIDHAVTIRDNPLQCVQTD